MIGSKMCKEGLKNGFILKEGGAIIKRVCYQHTGVAGAVLRTPL